MQKFKSLIELVILMVAVLAPQFLLASEVDGDEFAKATSGIALGGVVVGAYKVWKNVTGAQKPLNDATVIED